MGTSSTDTMDPLICRVHVSDTFKPAEMVSILQTIFYKFILVNHFQNLEQCSLNHHQFMYQTNNNPIHEPMVARFIDVYMSHRAATSPGFPRQPQTNAEV